ncbi:hypothetical protein O3P69_015653, partial [Scylla paramamosain]
KQQRGKQREGRPDRGRQLQRRPPKQRQEPSTKVTSEQHTPHIPPWHPIHITTWRNFLRQLNTNQQRSSRPMTDPPMTDNTATNQIKPVDKRNIDDIDQYIKSASHDQRPADDPASMPNHRPYQ